MLCKKNIIFSYLSVYRNRIYVNKRLQLPSNLTEIAEVLEFACNRRGYPYSVS